MVASKCVSVCRTGRGQIQWDFVHGLMEFAIYGGRVDNVFDMQVMVSYLRSFFDDSVLGEGARGSKKLGPLRVPASTSFRVSVLQRETSPFHWLHTVYIFTRYKHDQHMVNFAWNLHVVL